MRHMSMDYPVWFALLLTFGVGFASGLFGIGGGSILVPAMILTLFIPTPCRSRYIHVHGVSYQLLSIRLRIYHSEMCLGFIRFQSFRQPILGQKSELG